MFPKNFFCWKIPLKGKSHLYFDTVTAMNKELQQTCLTPTHQPNKSCYNNVLKTLRTTPQFSIIFLQDDGKYILNCNWPNSFSRN